MTKPTRAFMRICFFGATMIVAWPAAAADNAPPPGFVALFNGKNLDGWKGLVADPPKRAKMSAEELAQQQTKADESMRAHWRAEDGALVFDGKGQSLCTAKDYADFELLVDWKILKDGDSGIYLRGSPQVQIWDPALKTAGGTCTIIRRTPPSRRPMPTSLSASGTRFASACSETRLRFISTINWWSTTW